MDEHHKKEPSLQDANHPAYDGQKIGQSKFSLLVCSHEATDQLLNNDKLNTIKIATFRRFSKPQVNLFQDDKIGLRIDYLHSTVCQFVIKPSPADPSFLGWVCR